MAVAIASLGIAQGEPASAIPTAPAARKTITSRDESGQFEVIGWDVLMNATFTTGAESARKLAAAVVGLPRKWKTRIHLRLDDGDRDRPPPQYPMTRAIRNGPALDFEVRFNPHHPQIREELLRTLMVLFLYERVLEGNPDWVEKHEMPLLPFWLTEGLHQLVFDAGDRQWEKVVGRAVAQKRAPSLADIQDWHGLREETLQRLWQQAFAYYLVSSVTEPGPARERFHSWLTSSQTHDNNPLLNLSPLMPTEIEWRSRLSHAAERSRNLVYSWDETSRLFADSQTLLLRDPDSGEELLARLNQLASHRHRPGLAQAVADKIEELINLELRAHFLWRPIIAHYRLGLANLHNGKAKPEVTYESRIAEADAEIQALNQAHSLLTDYLNWFAVTQPLASPGSAFSDYHLLRQRLDHFDPRQVDPLRTTAITIEKGLEP
jgi:hypothetical protein